MLQVPTPPEQPIFKSPPVVIGLVAVLVTVHVALFYAGAAWREWALAMFSFSPGRYVASDWPNLPGGGAFTFISYAFLHASWDHLFFNSLWLLIFGTVVARYLGAWRFLALSAIAAASGAAATLVLHWGEVGTSMIGASGAVSGMMTAAVPVMYGRRKFLAGGDIGDPRNAVPLTAGELLRNRGAIIFMAVLLALTLFSGASGFTGSSFMSQGSIAWEAHIGGFIGGLAGFYLLARNRMRS